MLQTKAQESEARRSAPSPHTICHELILFAQERTAEPDRTGVQSLHYASDAATALINDKGEPGAGTG